MNLNVDTLVDHFFSSIRYVDFFRHVALTLREREQGSQGWRAARPRSHLAADMFSGTLTNRGGRPIRDASGENLAFDVNDDEEKP